MKEHQLEFALGELHPLARRLLSVRRTWPRGNPEGLITVQRIVHTCDWYQLCRAWADVQQRTELPPDPFPEVNW